MIGWLRANQVAKACILGPAPGTISVMNFMGPQKYNHRQLVKDLRGEDEDVCIFALRTVIQLEQGNLKGVTAIKELCNAINGASSGWSEETRFYADRALAHLKSIEHQFLHPEEEEEDLSKAEIDLEDLEAGDSEVVLRCLKMILIQEEVGARSRLLSMIQTVSDPQLLVALLQALAAIGEPATLFELRRLDDHANRRVRATYVQTIAALAENRAGGERLIAPFLKDKDGTVRSQAIAFLGPEDFEQVRAALDRTLTSKEVSDRAALTEALAAIQSEDVLPYLRNLCEDPDDSVRLKLLESLDRTGHPQRNFVIKKLTKDSSKIVARVAREAQGRLEAERLLAMGGFKAPEGKRNVPTVQEIHAQEDLDPIHLEDLKKESSVIKLQCLHKIRQRAYQQGRQAVFDLLGVSEQEEVLATILRCLTVIGAEKDADAVSHFLTHPGPQVRAAAAEALNQLGKPMQILYLLLPMLHDPALEVRGTVARAILAFEPGDVLKALSGMTLHASVTIRSRTVGLLLHYSGDAVSSTLTRMARDPAPEVRHLLASKPLPFEPWAEDILTLLAQDPVPEIAQATRTTGAQRQRFRESGRTHPALPPLTQLLEVARQTDREAESRRAELEALEAERLQQLEEQVRQAQEGSKGKKVAKSGVEGLAEKLGDDIIARKERENILLNRDNLLVALGQKLYKYVKAREIQHADYDRTIYLLDKYRHHLKDQPKAEATGGLWGALKNMAGVGEKEEQAARTEAKIHKAYIELGKICLDLSYKKNVIHHQLEIEYIELEAALKRIEDLGIEG
jgi:HEAT repeat protein